MNETLLLDPCTLHLGWARRPVAFCRAMIHLLGRMKDESEIAGLRYVESLPFSIDRDGFGLTERADFGVPGPRSHQLAGESLQNKPIGPISKAVGAPLDVVAHRQ
jgi:hypothetical protein